MVANKCYAVSLGNKPSSSSINSTDSVSIVPKSKRTRSSKTNDYNDSVSLYSQLPSNKISFGRYDRLAFAVLIILIIVFIGFAVYQYWKENHQ